MRLRLLSAVLLATGAANIGAAFSGGPYSSAYGVAAEDAVFEGTGGAVTIAATAPTAESLTFTAGGYTIGGGTLTLSGGDAGLIATGASSMLSVQASSHGAGQTRPVNSGKLFVEWRFREASSQSPL